MISANRKKQARDAINGLGNFIRSYFQAFGRQQQWQRRS